MIDQNQIIQDVKKIREKAPLIHNITNYVVMNSTANALLSIGASPVMAHAVEEVEEMVSLASALVVNIGTLSEKWIEAMYLAGGRAKKMGIPVVLDPVGAGATEFRTKTTNSIIREIKPQIIRGNGSELLAIAQTGFTTKGVDSTATSETALEAAKDLAKNTGSVVSISGKNDYVTDGNETCTIKRGHPLMGRVTGTGCIATALTAAFSGINPHYFTAATEAMVIMGMAGEMAAEESDAPGTFSIKFLDALYKIDGKQIKKRWENE